MWASSISECCSGKLLVVGNCFWRYDGEFPDVAFYKKHKQDVLNKKHNNPQIKAVVQLSMNSEIIQIFKSISEAERTLNICKICLVCQGKRKSAGGFLWRYADATEKEIIK